jgi:DNA invertase Pin-like site-specific DNA recombinase
MKTAYLYLRVNTPMQNPTELMREQEEALRKYCRENEITADKVFKDHASAGTFNRPGWQQLVIDLTNSTGKPDLILFTTWDRFSRNAPEALTMIKALNKMGIEAMATTQGRAELYDPIEKLLLDLKNTGE